MTLAGSPALDLVIASLTGRGRASAADSKIFKNSLGSSSLFCKRLPTSYLPLPPSPYLPSTTPSTPRVWSCSFPCPKKPLSASRGRGAVDTRSSSSSSSQHLFSFSYGHSSSSSSSLLVPTPSGRRLSQPGPAPSTHQICLPAWPNSKVSFCASAVGSTQHPDKRHLLSPTHCCSCCWSSVVDPPTLKFSVLSKGFREPRAPRGRTEPRVVFSTHSSLSAGLPQLSWLFLLGAHHKSRPDLFRSPLRRPRHHAFRDTCCPLAKTNKTPHNRPARFLPGFAAKAISRAPLTRATSPCCVPRLGRAYVRGTH